jgi:long-subunit fatty acid transport protein
MTRHKRVGTAFVLGTAATSLLAPQLAHAGGLFAGEAGSQAGARAGAFVAKADDPTAMMHNPAGLTKVTGFQLFLGANIVSFTQTFDRSGVYQDWLNAQDGAVSPYAGEEMPEISNSASVQPIPFVAFTQNLLGGRLTLAEGLFAPSAYPNRTYPEQVKLADGTLAPAPQRYDMVKQESLAALPSIAAGFRITDQLDIGLRFSWGFSTLKARTYLWALPNHEEDVEQEAIFDLDVSDSFVPGFGGGVLYRPHKNLEIGLAYSSQLDLDMQGRGSTDLKSRSGGPGQPVPSIGPVRDEEAACAPGGTDMHHLKACVDIIVPMTATAGARYVLRDGADRELGDIELDVRWENHSASKDIDVLVDAEVDEPIFRYLNETIIHHGFEDSWSFRLGGSYRIPLATSVVEARGGVSYDTATAPESWSRLDIDGSQRFQLALGASWQVGRWRFDLGGAAIVSPERTVDNGDPFTPPAEEPPQDDRNAPDPSNPLEGPQNQAYHPFNNGTFNNHYLIVQTGVTVAF